MSITKVRKIMLNKIFLVLSCAFLSTICYAQEVVFEEEDFQTYDIVGNDTVFVVVEEMPEFPGGVAKMNEYLGKNIIYPEYAVNNNIEGRVIVEFIVNTDGTITSTKVKRGVHESLDNEALRVVKSMPKWKPGKNDGKLIRVMYTLPINFNLDIMPKFSSDEERIEYFLRSRIEQNIDIQITEMGAMENFSFPIVRYKYQTPEIFEERINENKEIFEYIKSLSYTVKISHYMPAVISFKEPNEEVWSPAWYLVLMNENKDIIEMVSYYP